MAKRDEIKVYLLEAVTEEYFNCPLKWWLANKHRFPRLYGMAIDFLSIPPALTECERCFSLAKLTVGSQRHGLKEDTVNYIKSYRQWKRSER